MQEFRVGNALSTAFSVWTKNLVPFALIMAILHAPLWLLQIFAGIDLTGGGEGAIAFILVFAVIGLVLTMIATGAMAFGTYEQMRGRHASVGQCLQVGLKRLFPIIGVALLAGLCVGGAAMLFLIPGLIVYCMLWVAVPVVVVEKIGVTAALGRSAKLTAGNRWRVFGVVVVLGLINWLVTTVFSTALASVFASVGLGAALVLQNLPTIFTGSLTAVATAVGYYQLHIVTDNSVKSAAPLSRLTTRTRSSKQM